MDAGIIAKIKGVMRRLYGTWVVGLVRDALRGGTRADAIQVSLDH